MEGLILALLGYPLSIIANFTYDQLLSFKDRFSDFDSLEKLYIKSFQNAVKRHGDGYLEYRKEYEITQKIRKAVRRDKKKLLKAIAESEVTDLKSFSDSKFHEEVATKVIDFYGFSKDEDWNLTKNIIIDSFKYYRSAFFNLMNEKDGIQLILMECLKLNEIIDLLHKIENKSIDRGEFDSIRRIVFDNYRKDNDRYIKCVKDYDRYIKEKFKYLELRGFSPKVSGKEVQMELDDIFVPLSIDEQRRFIPNISDEYPYTKSEKVGTFDILKYRSLVILGDPGSGKSTLLKYLALQVIGLRRKKHIIRNIIPVFFRLSDYSDYYKYNKKSIYEFLTNHFDSQYQHIFKESFEYSNLLILMDGLDEITNTPLRLKVTEQVNDLIARYPNNQYIVTSRIVGYQEAKLGSNFNHYKLLPFRKEEIEIFANQWYTSIAQHTDKDFEAAKLQAKSLYDSISRNPSVIKLASNPLLMTIIAMIHYQGKKLPSKRIELYEISTDTFLEHWVQLRIGDEKQLKDKTEIIEILAPIAFKIHETKSNALIEEQEFKREFLDTYQSIHTNSSPKDAKRICDEFIDFLRKQTGFFYEKGVDDDNNRYYGFMHLTFEEYLAATELVSRWSEDDINLKHYVFQPRWTEVMRLAAAQIRLSFKGKAGRTQASKFIRNVLEVEDNFPDAYRPLQMACLIISDDVSINDDLFNEIINKVFEVLSVHTNESLINSFSKLLRELSLCDKGSSLIDRIVNLIYCDNNISVKNIKYILMDNYLIKPFSDIITNNISSFDIRNLTSLTYGHPLKKDELYERIISKSSTNNDYNVSYISNLIYSVIHEDNFHKIKDNDVLIDFLNKIEDKNIQDMVLSVIIHRLMRAHFINGSIQLDKFCDNYKHKKTDLVKEMMLEYSTKHSSYSASSSYAGEYHYISKKIFMSGTVYIYLISNDIKKHHAFVFKTKNWQQNFKDLKIIGEKNLLKLKYRIYPFLKEMPDKDDEDALSIFINNSFKEHVGWGGYPFHLIEKQPEELSRIIIRNSKYFLSISETLLTDSMNGNKLDIPTFLKLKVPPPVKLLACVKSEHAYDSSLIDESIEFYNNCDEELKEGVFDIIYHVLQFNYS